MKTFLIFLIPLVFLTMINQNVEAQTLEEQKLSAEIEKLNMEKTKLQHEAEQLELANNALKNPAQSEDPTEFEQSLISSFLTIVGSVVGATATGAYTWYRAKMIIPLSEQEKLFRELVKKDLSSQYKRYWDEIRDNVLGIVRNNEEEGKEDIPELKTQTWVSSENNASLIKPDNEKLEEYWKIICQRDFPKELQKKILKNHHDNILDYIDTYHINYLKKRRSETKHEYEKRIKKLANSLTKRVHSEYFDKVTETLPKLVKTAVTISKPCEESKNNWLKDSLQKLKWLMILNGISEYEETVKFMLAEEIKYQLKEINDISKMKDMAISLVKDLKGSDSITDMVYDEVVSFLTKK